MWDDATYGGDFDLDIRYRIYVKTGLTTITVKTKPIYASAGNGNWAGFYINGVAANHSVTTPVDTFNNILTGASEYYDIRCGGSIPTGSGNGNECQRYNNAGAWTSDTTAPYTNIWVERTFTVTGTNAGLLKDPCGTPASTGDSKIAMSPATTGYNLPDKTAEWDANGDGLPDTYFYDRIRWSWKGNSPQPSPRS